MLRPLKKNFLKINSFCLERLRKRYLKISRFLLRFSVVIKKSKIYTVDKSRRTIKNSFKNRRLKQPGSPERMLKNILENTFLARSSLTFFSMRVIVRVICQKNFFCCKKSPGYSLGDLEKKFLKIRFFFSERIKDQDFW